MKLGKCRICGKDFAYNEKEISMWEPIDQCPSCRKKLLSGKIIPQLGNSEIVDFREVKGVK